MHDLPDWGKLIFREEPPKDLAAALPGAPPEAVQLVGALLQVRHWASGFDGCTVLVYLNCWCARWVPLQGGGPPAAYPTHLRPTLPKHPCTPSCSTTPTTA